MERCDDIKIVALEVHFVGYFYLIKTPCHLHNFSRSRTPFSETIRSRFLDEQTKISYVLVPLNQLLKLLRSRNDPIHQFVKPIRTRKVPVIIHLDGKLRVQNPSTHSGLWSLSSTNLKAP